MKKAAPEEEAQRQLAKKITKNGNLSFSIHYTKNAKKIHGETWQQRKATTRLENTYESS